MLAEAGVLHAAVLTNAQDESVSQADFVHLFDACTIPGEAVVYYLIS